jgi:CheY-like chemotaxis protein
MPARREAVSNVEFFRSLLAQHAYDLVVCDLHLSDLDGALVYRAIERQPSPRPAVVFVTGAADTGRYKTFLKTTQASVVGRAPVPP